MQDEADLLLGDVGWDSLGPQADLATAWDRWRGFAEIAPAMPSPPAGDVALVNAAGNEDWFQFQHAQTGQADALGLYFADDVEVTSFGLMYRSGLVLGDNTEPYQVARQFAQAEGLRVPVEYQRRRKVRLNDPALLIAGPGHCMWGHWLVDFLPRLALAVQALGTRLDDCIIPLPSDTPDWAEALLRTAFGIPREKLLYYNYQHEILVCRRAIIPTFVHTDYFFHPHAATIFDSLARRFGLDVAPTRRLFVTRLAFRAQHPHATHAYAFERALEELADRRGYAVVAPESLNIDLQFSLFARARAIAGISGSGLHNALLSPRGSVVAQVGVPNPVQSRIAALRGHRMVYLIPPEHDEQPLPRSCMSAFFEAVESDVFQPNT